MSEQTKTADTSAPKTTKTTTKKSGTKPNALSVLSPKKKVLIYNEKFGIDEILASDYTVDEGTEAMIHISTVDYLKEKKEGPKRVPVSTIGVSTFIYNSTAQGLQARVDGGGVAFQLADDIHEAGLQAFNILLACTEHTKEKNGNVVFTEKAKKLVSERFNLFKAGDIILKCKELRFLNWGTTKAFVDDILHFPGFTGKVEIDEFCTPTIEVNYGKDAFDLPE